MRCVGRARWRRARNVSNNVVGRPGIGLRVTTTSTSGRTAAPIRAGVAVAVGGEDEARVMRSMMDLSRSKSFADQRVGGRDRRVGMPTYMAAKADERMLDVVAGEDRDRPLG